jgi:tRNA(Met) C34 N-acetyltransferase TmcA
MTKSSQKKWQQRVKNAISIVEKASEKRDFEMTHTSDGVELELGLEVFRTENPIESCSVAKCEKRLGRNVEVIVDDEEEDFVLKKVSSKSLYVDQKKAINASIKEIKDSKKVILRDMRESLCRLDAENRIKILTGFKNKIKKKK